ncbi:MAG TPA: pilin [Candidatus Saccharimonadia bacterium]
MKVALRRTLLSLTALGSLALLRTAVPSTGSTKLPAQPDEPEATTPRQLASNVNIVMEALGLSAEPVYAVTSPTPCTDGYIPTRGECTVPTPTPTPAPRPTRTPVATAPPSSNNSGGGSTIGTTNCSGDTGALGNNPASAGASCAKAKGTSTNLFGNNSIFQAIANTLVFLVGAVSVLFLIVGGLRYVISQGDSKATASAKNTILYAIISIVVAVISFALINFVINAVSRAT